MVLPLNTVGQLARTIADLMVQVPASSEPESGQPQARAHRLGRAAARRASMVAGSLALPPGPLGWLTILPERYAVWKLQAKLVSDIASVYGKAATLNREQMLYCLFKHVSAQLLRDGVVPASTRVLIHKANLNTLRAVASRLGPTDMGSRPPQITKGRVMARRETTWQAMQPQAMDCLAAFALTVFASRIAHAAFGKGVSRLVPLVGALGVGAHAYFDTLQVARTASELFARDLILQALPAT